MLQGGASGRPGLWETSASGAAALLLPGSAGPRSCTWNPTPAPTIPESHLPSLCRQLSQLVMLEHLSSLPTQMVRARPQDPHPHPARFSGAGSSGGPCLFPELCFPGPRLSSPARSPLPMRR